MNGFGRSALVVDDNRHMRFMLAEMLRGFGFRTVDEASNLTQANALIDKRRHDCALVDMGLGAESGLEVIRSIRCVHGADVPVLVVSGENVTSTVRAAGAAGANGFLVKPFSTAGLAEKLAKVLARPDHAGASQTLARQEPPTPTTAAAASSDDDLYI